MDRKQVLEKVLEFFRQKGIEVENSVDMEKIRYLEEGWLDSFDLVEFLIYLEHEFNIELSSEDLQTESFRTLGGVVETILKKLS